MASLVHLVRRFFGAIRPGPPDPVDVAWALGHLGPGEQALWARMNNPDRRHAVDVARKVAVELGSDADDRVLAAALLHDVGKVECGYRTPARVMATLVWAVVPHERATSWLDRSRPFRRLAQYRLHPELGEELLADAGSDPLTSSWAADHHLPAVRWRIDPVIGHVLKDCDDD